MVAHHGENYGKLTSYEIPTTQVAPSPAQAATLIESDPVISSVFTPLDLRGSEIIRGNVQLIPLGDTIVYARARSTSRVRAKASSRVCASSPSRIATTWRWWTSKAARTTSRPSKRDCRRCSRRAPPIPKYR